MAVSEIIFVLAKGLLVTFQIALGAWVVAVLLGLLLCLARDMGSRPLRWLVNALIALFRSVPQLVLIYLFYFGSGAIGLHIPGIVAAIFALGITESAFHAEYYRGALMVVSPNQREAGKSLGLSGLKTFRLIVLPQAIPYALAPMLNSFISLAKLATLAAAVGSPEVLYSGQSLMQLTGQVTLVISLVIVIYIVFSVPLSRLVRRLEERIEVA